MAMPGAHEHCVYTLGDSLITEVTEAAANKNRLDFNDAALVAAAAAAGNKLGCLSVTSSASGVILKHATVKGQIGPMHSKVA